jgi:putative flippase GtrA
LITIAIITPLSFLLNKFWTFSAVRVRHQVAETAPEETIQTEHPTAGV